MYVTNYYTAIMNIHKLSYPIHYFSLSAAITAFTICANDVESATVIFEDHFEQADTNIAAEIASPSQRGSGQNQSVIKYLFRGNIAINSDGSTAHNAIRIANHALDFSTGLKTNKNQQIKAPDTNGNGSPGPFIRDLAFIDSTSGSEFNWAPLLGNHYEISFQMQATFNAPLAFSISDVVTLGRYNPHVQKVYDFGLSNWAKNWVMGSDGNYTSKDAVAGAQPAKTYILRIVVDERASVPTAQVYANEVLIKTLTINFEKTARYFQFNARDGYGGTLDALIIKRLAPPASVTGQSTHSPIVQKQPLN